MSPFGSDTEKRPLEGPRGFTIVELVIVMSLMIILAGIVAPRLEVSPTRRVEGVARQIVAHLELARSNALGMRLMTKVVFNPTAGTYTAYVDHDRDSDITLVVDEVNAFSDFGEQDLGVLVQFGRGTSTTIPGDPSLLSVTLTDNTLDLSVQGVPEPWGTMGTVYLVHRDDANAVSAITISSSGAFKAWRWSPGAGEWQ
jgi:type II secretory pathway pseudopilin PulG